MCATVFSFSVESKKSAIVYQIFFHLMFDSEPGIARFMTTSPTEGTQGYGENIRYSSNENCVSTFIRKVWRRMS